MNTRDGWHKVYRYDVMVEDGIVSHACDYDVMVEDGIVSHACDIDHTRTLYPYKSSLWGTWNRIYKEEKLTLSALRSGMRRGTISLI